MRRVPTIPDSVQRYFKEATSGQHKDSKETKILKTLMAHPEGAAFWRPLAKRNVNNPDLWIYFELVAIRRILDEPDSAFIAPADAKDATDEIVKGARQIIRNLKRLGWDWAIECSKDGPWHGYSFRQDARQARRISDSQKQGNPIIELAGLLRGLEEHVETWNARRENAPYSVKNVRANFFARELTNHFLIHYRSPLREAVAAATNALFGTAYSRAYISQLAPVPETTGRSH